MANIKTFNMQIGHTFFYNIRLTSTFSTKSGFEQDCINYKELHFFPSFIVELKDVGEANSAQCIVISSPLHLHSELLDLTFSI